MTRYALVITLFFYYYTFFLGLVCHLDDDFLRDLIIV